MMNIRRWIKDQKQSDSQKTDAKALWFWFWKRICNVEWATHKHLFVYHAAARSQKQLSHPILEREKICLILMKQDSNRFHNIACLCWGKSKSARIAIKLCWIVRRSHDFLKLLYIFKKINDSANFKNFLTSESDPAQVA